MIRVVIDTNVLISAFINPGRSRDVLEKVFKGDIRLISSPAILSEFEEVLSREKFGFTKDQVAKVLSIILRVSEVITPKISINVVSDDPDDNKILECALDGKATNIISGDKHLLRLKIYKSIGIYSPNQFLRKCSSK